MKPTMKLSCILLSLCLNLYCAEQKSHTDKIARKSFSTGTPIKQTTAHQLLHQEKRTLHIKALNFSIDTKQPVPAKIIFDADHDITEKALRHNQGLFDQALRQSK